MKQRILTKSEIDAILASRFGLTADVQVIHPKGEGRTLYQLEHIPLNRRMTIGGLERLCRRIANELDAELYGTVNIDLVSLGEQRMFDLMLEVEHEPKADHT